LIFYKAIVLAIVVVGFSGIVLAIQVNEKITNPDN